MRNAFSKDYKFVQGNALCEAVLVTDQYYPATGNYIDVSGYEWVNVVIRLGTLGDAFKFEVFQTDATNGSTLDSIHATLCEHSVATTDDGDYVTFYIETARLAEDHHFVTTRVTSLTGSNYASIDYYLGGTRHQPVSQTSDILPAASQHICAG